MASESKNKVTANRETLKEDIFILINKISEDLIGNPDPNVERQLLSVTKNMEDIMNAVGDDTKQIKELYHKTVKDLNSENNKRINEAKKKYAAQVVDTVLETCGLLWLLSICHKKTDRNELFGYAIKIFTSLQKCFGWKDGRDINNMIKKYKDFIARSQ